LKAWKQTPAAARQRAVEEIGAAELVAALPGSMRAEVLKRLQAKPKNINNMEKIDGAYEVPSRASQH